MGLRPILLTGDNERAAKFIAAQVGIDDVIAQVLPEDKRDVVARLQGEGLMWPWWVTVLTTPPL